MFSQSVSCRSQAAYITALEIVLAHKAICSIYKPNALCPASQNDLDIAYKSVLSTHHEEKQSLQLCALTLFI